MHTVISIAALVTLATGAIPAYAQPTASQFTVVAGISPGTVANGGTVTLAIHTRIGADCIGQVIYDDGGAGPTLPSRHIGGAGIDVWRFAVQTAAGGGAAAVACAKDHQALGLAHFKVADRGTPMPAATAASPLPVGPYPAYHADMIWVEPYRVETRADIGSPRPAPEGEKYLVVWLAAANRNDVPLGSAESEFTVVDSSGQIDGPYFQSPSPAYGGTLLPGASMKGSITFAVPAASHSVQLKWQANPYETGWPTFTWTLRY